MSVRLPFSVQVFLLLFIDLCGAAMLDQFLQVGALSDAISNVSQQGRQLTSHKHLENHT